MVPWLNYYLSQANLVLLQFIFKNKLRCQSRTRGQKHPQHVAESVAGIRKHCQCVGQQAVIVSKAIKNHLAPFRRAQRDHPL